MNEERWPSATLDPIRRARVVASAVPGGFAETVFDVPCEQAWAWLSDLERSVPSFDAQVDRLKITARAPSIDGVGEDLSFTASKYGLKLPFNARIEDGWCLMKARGRAFVVVMAVVPDGPDRTRYAQFEAVPLPGGGIFRRRLTRDVMRDVEGIRAHLTK